jgi:hypothetical protein
MLECLRQYLVTPTWCNDTTVVNNPNAISLVGMGLTGKFASGISNADLDNGRKIIEAAMNLAYSQMYENLMSGKDRVFRLNTIIAKRDKACTDVSQNSGIFSTREGGTQVLINRISQYSRISIKRLEVHLDQDTPVDLVISDSSLNTLTMSVNKSQIFYDIDFETNKPTITLSFPVGTKVKWFYCPSEKSSGCLSCQAKRQAHAVKKTEPNFIEFRGANGTYLSEEGSAYGVIPTVQVECSFDSLICDFANRLSIPFAHFVMANIYKLAINSPSLNIFSITNTKEDYEKMYEFNSKTGFSFLNSIKDSMNDYLKRSGADICIQCTGYTSATYMP